MPKCKQVSEMCVTCKVRPRRGGKRKQRLCKGCHATAQAKWRAEHPTVPRAHLEALRARANG